MRHVVALDVGTTTLRCHLIDESGTKVASACEKIHLLYPNPSYVEIDPDQLWESIVRVVKNTIFGSTINIESIVSLGISTQRGSFTTWNRTTGRHYHNFITWKDLRANSMVKEWNSSMMIKGLRTGAYLFYSVSRSKRLKAASGFKLMNTQITMRLLWAIQNIPGLKEAVGSGTAVFGGVDSWLLFKLTGNHITDVTNASATGIFDPFTMQWANWAQFLFKIPPSILPKVISSTGDFGTVPKDIFGVELPIKCSMADQSASMFGSGCFQPGSLKITLGTGSFLDVNTGGQPHSSVNGLYPLVAWQIGSELLYMAEGASNDTGSVIEWAVRLDLIKDAAKTSDIAYSVSDSGGVYFVPAFSGLQELPINDQKAATGFIGITPTTTKAHLVRSILESIVFRVLLLLNTMRSETNYSYNVIRVDGGVSQNDFILQLLADLSGLQVVRHASIEMSILGVGFLAGLQSGIWKDRQELLQLHRVDKIFEPDDNRRLQYEATIAQWKEAIHRFKNWY